MVSSLWVLGPLCSSQVRWEWAHRHLKRRNSCSIWCFCYWKEQHLANNINVLCVEVFWLDTLYKDVWNAGWEMKCLVSSNLDKISGHHCYWEGIPCGWESFDSLHLDVRLIRLNWWWFWWLLCRLSVVFTPATLSVVSVFMASSRFWNAPRRRMRSQFPSLMLLNVYHISPLWSSLVCLWEWTWKYSYGDPTRVTGMKCNVMLMFSRG